MSRDPLRVLNLEADPEDHERVRRQAVSTGLRIEFQHASSRGEFEAALKRGQLDVILADHCIPGYDGMAALESALLSLPDVPYIIVSDSIGEDTAVECIRRGAVDFVHKDRLERLPAVILEATRERTAPVHHLEAEERFKEMADVIRDVYWVCATDTGHIHYVSPAYESIWGRAPDALFSSKSVWPESVLEEDGAALAELRSKRASGNSYQVEYRIRRPDQSVRWVLDRGFPIPGKAGVQSRMVGVAADITERKQLEFELHQAQKMELVGKLAGGIAHDFNNLLTIISGYVSMLLDKDNLPPGSSEPLKRVFTASRQATGLVRQLLLFSRKRVPKREVLDLNTEFESIVGMLRRLLGETITVNFTPAPESPRVNADIGMLEQAVVNLAVNARDAMSPGGTLTVTIGVLARGSRPPLTSPVPSGEFAYISVSDTGTGIPPAILPRIFEPFYTTKDEGRGTGLGLPTVKDIAKRHDGWIDVDTKVGVGTTFRLCLPLTKAEMFAPSDHDVHRDAKTSKGTILLVEDEGNVREFAAAVLQQDGYTLFQAKSGDNALEVWKWHSGKIDLLLTDVVLPGEHSGPQLAARLLQEKPGLKVILTTGYSRENVAAQSQDGRPLFILNKPYTPRNLLQAVHEMLSQGRA